MRSSDATSSGRCAARRARVAQMLGEDGILILAATPELHAGADTELRYVVDSDLYYLTGYTEPGAVMVLTGRDARFTLFVRPRDEEHELWTGRRGGVEAATASFGADDAHPLSELAEGLPRLLTGCDRIFARTGMGRPEVDAGVRTALERARRTRPRTGHGPHSIIDHGVLLNPLRLIKDDDEIAILRQAAALSIDAFRDAAALIADGRGEWEIEAALAAGFRGRQGSGEAFPTIVGGGANATVLHYTTNDAVLHAGNFALLDAGARYRMYCADITRTYAVGAVSAERQAAHDIVRAAHDAAVVTAATGRTIDDVDAAARRVLVQGMLDLGLVDGPLDHALADPAHKRYYPHRTSHWLGLDVHDVGDYVDCGNPRRLEPGMVFTVEPGLYFPARDDRVPQGLRGVGIRLEDDVLITSQGTEVITAALPLDADPRNALH